MHDECGYRIVDNGVVISTFRYGVDMEFFFNSEMSRPRYQMQSWSFHNQEWNDYAPVS